MKISKKQKEAIEYLKTRLYGNEGCKYIDVSQEDLRIFINLIDRLQKENEELKRLMAHKNGYTKLLEEDLFENCSNYVVPIQTIKEKIEELIKEGRHYNANKIEVLQELLEESEE